MTCGTRYFALAYVQASLITYQFLFSHNFHTCVNFIIFEEKIVIDQLVLLDQCDPSSIKHE